MSLEMDFSKTGYEMFFKPYQVLALRYLWTIQNGAKSLEVWDHVKTRVEGSISRASIINSLNAMVDNGILDYVERTGKGGHHRVYTIAYTESEFKRHIAEIVISKLLKEYPQEAKKALQQL